MKENLKQLQDRGALGGMLVEKFGGERGSTSPSQDSDFLIIYKDESRVPTALAIRLEVDTFFQSRGFTMMRPSLTDNTYTVSAEDLSKEGLGLVINITVGYPWGSTHNSIRVTTQIR
jgi:hypothetical protein